MAGVAVASSVWSTAAMNIGRKTAKNSVRNSACPTSRPAARDSVLEIGLVLTVETPEHMPGAVLGRRIASAVEHFDAVHPHAAHALWVAQHARPATAQVLHALERRHAHAARLEEQEIGVIARRDETAPRDAV